MLNNNPIYVVSGVTYNADPALPKSVTEDLAVFDAKDKADKFIDNERENSFSEVNDFFVTKFELNGNGNY